MKITRKTAQKHIKLGRAFEVGMMSDGNSWPHGNKYVIVNRTDLMRTDHYPATDSDEKRFDKIERQ